MIFRHAILIIYVLFYTNMFAANCNCCLSEEYFNESILTYYISILDNQTPDSHPVLYKYIINSSSCVDDFSIDVEYKVFSPEIGINSPQTFYRGSIEVEPSIYNFTNHHITTGTLPNILGNDKLNVLISYISKTGKLPNGNYLFYFTLNNNSESLIVHKEIEVYSPSTLELLSPGGLLSDIHMSYTYNIKPFFKWYSNLCPQCEYSIRISEYNPIIHESLEDALARSSLVPSNQSLKYFSIGWNTNSFQYPALSHQNLEYGKYYVWQIQILYDTTIGENYLYSPIFVFEVRNSNKVSLDLSDPYFLALKSIIGNEQFYYLFSPGGELERYLIEGNTILMNNEVINLDVLYSILSDLKQNKITIDNIKIK